MRPWRGEIHMDKDHDLSPSERRKKKFHLPVIEAPNTVKRGEFFDFKIVVNKVPYAPSQIDPQRFWFTVYFLPQEIGRNYQVVQPLYATQKEEAKETAPLEDRILYQASFQIKAEKTGTIYAAAYCPIHGLSQSRTQVEVI
jgi:superoxide reductase